MLAVLLLCERANDGPRVFAEGRVEFDICTNDLLLITERVWFASRRGESASIIDSRGP